MSKGQEFVCDGALCECNQGTRQAKLTVSSHNKDHVQDKLIVTNQDKTFESFGACRLKKSNPCFPKPLDWKDFYDQVSIVKAENKPLLEGSTIPCAVGGTISIKDTLQIEVPGSPTPHNMEEIRTAFMSLCPVMLNESKE